MIKIEAAARLQVRAKADEGQARKYLKSLGIDVGEMTDNARGEIHFEVKDSEAAYNALRKHFGKPKQSKQVGASHFYAFNVDRNRAIIIWVGPKGRITLIDAVD